MTPIILYLIELNNNLSTMVTKFSNGFCVDSLLTSLLSTIHDIPIYGWFVNISRNIFDWRFQLVSNVDREHAEQHLCTHTILYFFFLKTLTDPLWLRLPAGEIGIHHDCCGTAANTMTSWSARKPQSKTRRARATLDVARRCNYRGRE